MIPHYDEIVTKARSLCKAKNDDYASDDDPFSNFKLAEYAGLSSTEGAILARILDKTSRVIQVLKTGNTVKDESLEDTALDLINYWIILLAYRKNK